jgi:hypothetical protein
MRRPTHEPWSGPGAAGQDEPVPVRIRDRDTPSFPVRIEGGDPGAARIDQAADHILADLATEVENQQVFFGGPGWRRIPGIADEFEVPGSIRPADHQQRMTAFCRDISPEQDVKSKALDPEPFG